MLYGLYLSAQGAEIQSRRLDVIANNMANADTVGFKRDRTVFAELLPYDLDRGSPSQMPSHLAESTGGAALGEVMTDHSSGPLMSTGGRFDLALHGAGFLRVTDGEQEFLTRDGQLTLSPRGELITRSAGLRVLDADGEPLTVPDNTKDVTIGEDGTLVAVDDEGVSAAVGRIDLVQPRSLRDLEKVGENRYRAEGPLLPAAGSARVRQGYLEGSGVEAVRETVQMIEASRAFEMNLNVLRLQDETLARLIQAIPNR
jgi:flagellar basal-body rod protein FlgF